MVINEPERAASMKFVNPLNEIEIATLQAMHHYHPSRRARMRAHCILLSHQHYPINDIARFYQVSRRRVSAWIHRWQDDGLVGLYDQTRSGRPPIYSEQQQKQIDDYLQKYPQDVKRIVEEMAQQTQKRVSTKTMKRYIKKKAKSGNELRRPPRNPLLPINTAEVNSSSRISNVEKIKGNVTSGILMVLAFV
jgi:transposase